jgi:hypothetical protein
MRSRLIDAKIDQLKQTVSVRRATHRVFENQQWKELGVKVNNWKDDVSKCLEILASVKDAN